MARRPAAMIATAGRKPTQKLARPVLREIVWFNVDAH
jgi:hypothetical protein